MSFAIIHSRAYVGLEAPLVSVETHLSSDLPTLTIVGFLGEPACIDLLNASVKMSTDELKAHDFGRIGFLNHDLRRIKSENPL